VKELEKETMALQNTLTLMTTSNYHIKDSLKPMLDCGVQAEVEDLEQKTKNLQIRKQNALKEYRQLGTQIDLKLREIEAAKDLKAGLENRIMDKEYDLRMLQSDIRNQEISRNRIGTLIQRILKELSFAGEGEKTLVSTDIKLRLMRRKFEVINYPDELQFNIRMSSLLQNLIHKFFLYTSYIVCYQRSSQASIQFPRSSHPS
jgi:chromosome segregation ATPase